MLLIYFSYRQTFISKKLIKCGRVTKSLIQNQTSRTTQPIIEIQKGDGHCIGNWNTFHTKCHKTSTRPHSNGNKIDSAFLAERDVKLLAALSTCKKNNSFLPKVKKGLYTSILHSSFRLSLDRAFQTTSRCEDHCSLWKTFPMTRPMTLINLTMKTKYFWQNWNSHENKNRSRIQPKMQGLWENPLESNQPIITIQKYYKKITEDWIKRISQNTAIKDAVWRLKFS